MARIENTEQSGASGELKTIFSEISSKMGKVPHIFQYMGNSPTVLKAFLAMSEAASKTSLNAGLREEIALAVGQANKCNYCLAAHTAIAQKVGLSNNQIINARQARSQDPKHDAILQFTQKVVTKNGHVNDADIEELRDEGVSSEEIVEITFLIMLNMFTNYFNHIVDPAIDFPQAPVLTR